MFTDYKKIEEIIINFIRKETDRIGIKKAVLGLSGGIDSAVVAYLLYKALGNENILVVKLPYKSSSDESKTDAQKVIDDLKLRSETIDISPMVDAYLNSYAEKEISNVRKGNIMARMRMIVLYDLSARENALVYGTGNKTEICLGYSTMFGDSACALDPVGDLYKTQIRGLAKHLGVPKSIIDKKPSADLWQGQNDEDELGIIYEDVDKFLFDKIDNGKSDAELLNCGYESDYIKKINRLITGSEFKRNLPKIACLK